jgi:hypothetical protein
MSLIPLGIVAGAGRTASSYESIATVTAAGSSNTITFSSIASTYASLQIRMIGRQVGTYNGNNRVYMTFNNDTASNYAYHFLQGNGSGTSAFGYVNNTNCEIYNPVIVDGATSNAFGAGIIDIHDYANTSKFKTVRYFCGADANTADTGFTVNLGSALWRSTSAINSISITTGGSNFMSGTTFALYGIKG